jgi:nucleoporin GLE1
MVFLGIFNAQSSSSDDEAHEASDSYRSPFSSRYAKYQTYVWDDDEESDDECSTSMGTMQQRFLESLRDSADVDGFGDGGDRGRSGQRGLSDRHDVRPADTYAEFLKQDALARENLEENQRRMLSALEERHRELYAKDRETVKLVVTGFQAELAEKERVEQAGRREEERRVQERVMQEEALKAQETRDQEAERLAAEKERALYNLMNLASVEALENHEALVDLLSRYNSELMPFCEDTSAETRGVKRSIKKFITLSVQQISATQEQVKRKSAGILEFLAQQHGLHQKFALVTLASKMVSQCDAQISRLPSFAFPLGEVAVSVGRAFPDFLKLLLAMLQNECPLCVPMIVQPGPKAGKDIKYYEALRFKVTEGTVENVEEYVTRLQGFLRLYAAVLQVEREPQSMEAALGAAWAYTAWLLNALPASRFTASALDAFLSVAGWRMSGRFGRQFVKMMEYVSTHFLKELGDLDDPDANAVATRLGSFVGSQMYRTEPKGRTMPLRDISSQSRA